MEQNTFIKLLLRKDLRTVKQNDMVVQSVRDQRNFDELFTLVFHRERPLVMRAIDAIEKITREDPFYLLRHKTQLLHVLKSADHKELKWHVAQLISRIPLSDDELKDVWHVLDYWARNVNESKITRVNALQGLFDLSMAHPEFKEKIGSTIAAIDRENIPSLQVRIARLKKKLRLE